MPIIGKKNNIKKLEESHENIFKLLEQIRIKINSMYREEEI